MDIQIYGRQIDKQTDGWIDKWTEIQPARKDIQKIDGQIDRQISIYIIHVLW